ncbi:phosphatase PAP2 family protein [Actinomycetes bacterium KLBMP 9759]
MTDGRDDPTPTGGSGVEPPAGLPAGLREPFVPPPPRPGLGAGVAVLLGSAAMAALWAALVGVGPAVLDSALLAESVDARSGELTASAILVTDVGSTLVMAVLAVSAGAWSWYRGRRADAVLAIGAMVGASIVFRLLKIVIARPRPPEISRLVVETNESLPSGHATMSTVVLGTLVVLGWARRRLVGRVLLVAGAAAWVGAVGATRIYLGVHWFSDVVAGWLVGAAWLAVCVALWSWWRARHPAVAVVT